MVSISLPPEQQIEIPETENLPVADLLEAAAPGFRILTCYPANSDDRQSCAPDQNERKGQNKTDFGRDIFLHD